MPGVADQIRRTNLKQDQKARKGEMDELIRLVQEDRLHEADERQLETLRLISDIQGSLKAPTAEAGPVTVNVDNTEVIEAVRKAMGELIANMPTGGFSSPAEDPDRPKMKHTSLADLAQSGDEVTISNEGTLGDEQSGTEDSADQLEKLKKLKRQ